MSSFPKFNVNTMDALAVAIAVFKQHNNRVDRFNNETKGNKEDIIDHFVNGSNLELDTDNAELVKKIIAHTVTMNSISGNSTSDFLFTIFELLEKDTVSIREAGILAWAPKLAHDLRKTEEDRAELHRVGINSRNINPVGGKITLNFVPLKLYHLKSHDSYCHTGHDGNGNLVRFYNKKKIEVPVTISAKIKTHRRDPVLGNADITILNYVKEIK